MMKRFLPITLVFALLIAGSILTAHLGVQQMSYAEETGVTSAATEFLGRFNASLSQISDAVKPSVVNISTTRTVDGLSSQFGGLPDDPFFRRFFGNRYRDFGRHGRFKTSALGSGVIVTKDGYILTNNHVVKDADEIKVILYDRREFDGKVIGTDPKTDLAVIKINAAGLPAAKIGDSGAIKVGELVVAVGNPFALDHTITMGIVSAVGRSNVGIADYEDFIQTDAAINPGNSGGALVNIKGELIGINTAIFSTNGGYMGIGFAIPSALAGSVMESIIQHGRVIRGWLGVTIQNLTPELAKHFDVKEGKGSLVTDIVKDSPAEKAGIRRGDLIMEVDGKTVENSTSLRNMVAHVTPGKSVSLKVVRDGREKTLKITLGEFPDTVSMAKSEYSNAMKGIHVQDLTPEIRGRMDIPEKIDGVIVTDVEGDSPAAGGLRPDDIIEEVNRKGISNVKDYEDIASRIASGDNVLLLVYRSGASIYVTVP